MLPYFEYSGAGTVKEELYSCLLYLWNIFALTIQQLNKDYTLSSIHATSQIA